MNWGITMPIHAPGQQPGLAAPRKLSAIIVAFGLLLMQATSVFAQDARNVVILETMTLPLVQNGTEWFREGLARQGFGDDEPINFTVLNAEGDPDLAMSLLQEELARGEPDLVVSVATLASRAAHSLLSDEDIPQLFFFVADPVGEGFVTEVGARSDRLLTGITHVIPAHSKLDIVSRTLVGRSADNPLRVGLVHSTYPSAVSDAASLVAESDDHESVVFSDLSFEYRTGEDGRLQMIEDGVALVEENRDALDAIWIPVGPTVNDADFVKAMDATGIPIIYSDNLFAVECGAMLGLISNEEVNGLAAAEVGASILRGQTANEIPVVRPGSFIAGVNISTAERLGAVLSSDILRLAQGNIYR